jgi:uncharacterized protein YcaQ
MPDRHLSRRPDAHALARRRPRIASRRAGPADPAAPQGHEADVLDAIRRMAQLQIDTIHVVARSPYLVLFSRVGNFDTGWLDEHLAEARLFEYWSHEACFLPVEQFGLMRYKMLDPRGMGWKYAADWHAQNRAEIDSLLARIRAQGPVKSADFVREDGVTGNGWWDRKPEKKHLEVLFTLGELMVSERRNFQRIYDVRERVLPDWDDARDLPPRGRCCRRCSTTPAARSASCARTGSPITTGCRAARIVPNSTRSRARAS